METNSIELEKSAVIEECLEDPSAVIHFNLMSHDGWLLAEHSISPYDTEDLQRFSEDGYNTIKDLQLPVYRGYVRSHNSGEGNGLKIWQETELEFVKREKDIIRYITDFSTDGWTTRKLPYLTDYLEQSGIHTELIESGVFKDTGYWIYRFSISNPIGQ